MRYFYARVSSKDQSLERQIKEFSSMGYTEETLFCDKASGKDFNRPAYKRMKKVLKEGDEVVIKELDRLGRNKDMVKEELSWFKRNGIVLRILDIPTTLMDFGEQGWVGEMVTNILFEVISSVAEQERVKIKTRQAEGIAAMKVVDGKKIGKSGRAMGRPLREIDWNEVKGMGCTEACEKLGISRSTYYRRAFWV